MSKFTRFAVVLVVVSGVVVGGLYIWNKNTMKQEPILQKTIVAFGDSLVYGTGSTQGNDFVSQLSAILESPIINLGVPGDTTSRGLERVNEVLAYKPDVVILLLGGNDALRNVPQQETFSNLRSLITTFQSNGSEVLLLGIRGRSLISDPYKSSFESLAKETNVEFVPDVLNGLFGDSRFMSDIIHPNDAGYRKIAEKVQPYLEKIVTKRESTI